MKVMFRTDASHLIGTGHVMRCLVLADQLKLAGHEITFACQPLNGNLISLIEQRGYYVIPLSEPKKPFIADGYLTWLERSIDDDVNDFIHLAGKIDWVVTDHYAIDYEWQIKVKKTLNCKIFAIDDLLREHSADLLLDSTIDRKSEQYKSTKIKLTGSAYAPLSPSFSCCREQSLDKKKPIKQPKVLISMGGVDAPNATIKVLKALVNKVDACFTVLLNPKAPHYQEVSIFCRNWKETNHIDFVEDMPKLMLEHDVAIGAAGVTALERACLGIPSIVIPIAENQQDTVQKLAEKNAIIAIALQDIEKKLLFSFNQIMNNFHEYREANFSLCDGRGIFRIINEFDQLTKKNRHISFTKITEKDIKQIFAWQNHPDTRRFANNSQSLEWQSYQDWMNKKIKRHQDYFLMIKYHQYQTASNKILAVNCGVIRLDRIQKAEYLLSIFVAPEYYQRRIASETLTLVDNIFPDITIKAEVSESNLASQKLFAKSSFVQQSNTHFIRHPLYSSPFKLQRC